MKKRKYAYMIVGCERGLMIGMETKCGMKISRCIVWAEIEYDAEALETNLDIMEQRIDEHLSKVAPTTFEEIFEVKLS